MAEVAAEIVKLQAPAGAIVTAGLALFAIAFGIRIAKRIAKSAS